MNFTRILALANRIIRQVVRDKRTLALIFIVPIVVMTLLYLVLTGTSNVHTLALVRPTGTGSDRVNTLINSLVPAQDKLKTINIAANSVNTNSRTAMPTRQLCFQQTLCNRYLRASILLCVSCWKVLIPPSPAL